MARRLASGISVCRAGEDVTHSTPRRDPLSSPVCEPGRAAAPCVFLEQDAHFFRLSLSDILGGARIVVLTGNAGSSILDDLRRIEVRPDLIVLRVQRPVSRACELLREISGIQALQPVRFLGLTLLDRSDLDHAQLRALGVVGLIDKSLIPEQIVFRVNQIVRPRPTFRRRHVRAPVFLPVDLEHGAGALSEYALDLSVAGLRVTSPECMEVGADVGLHLRIRSDSIHAKARVAHCSSSSNRPWAFESGLTFHPIEPSSQELLADEVTRSLACLHWP
jgi:CheY-like chemotaxis protein